ncbi:MAG: protein phosphatase 2C domain-containing protein [Candidatus Saccharibacteria bacterium]|nr:protein phosphatase 2C domain-containing protein [Candidatus Saccharibacteria bacterium]
MSIFSRFKGGSEKAKSGDGQKSGWDNMQPAVNRESKDFVADEERQKRKILTMYALGESSMAQVLNESDVQVDEKARGDILDMIANGQVNDELKHSILERIGRPSDIAGSQKVAESLNTKHEKRILAMMGGGDFNNYELTNGSNIDMFLQQYPTPMDFESTENAFLQHIGEMNGQEKQNEYAFAMEVFKRKVYGKRLEYYTQMKALDKEASDRYEQERSSEWIPGDVSCCQVSESQTRNGLVSRESIDNGLEKDDKCEDSVFIDKEQQLYGIFDGAGGISNGRYASQTASSVLSEYSKKYSLDHPSSLAYVLNEADKRISETPDMNGGCSTGVVAKVIELNGMPKLAYASVGDSRIYIVNKRGEARMITEDEGVGRILTNDLGSPSNNNEPKCQQFGFEDLREGDKVVICSDGITGDYGTDLMSDEELGRIVHNSHGAEDASKNLITNARKKDDRTAIVIVPDFSKF